MLENKKQLYSIIFFRFIVVSIILVVNTTLFGLARTPVYFIIGTTYVLTIIYLFLLLAQLSNTFFLYTQIILDLVIETVLVHYTGGINSVLGLLFPLSSIAASIIISPRAAVITALLGSILYAGIISLEYYNIIPLSGMVEPFAQRGSSYIFALLYFRVTIFCIIGFLSAYVSEQTNKKDKALISLREKLRREDRLSAIGKLAASTAHEIRNPLASISGCVEALKETLTLDKRNERLFNLIIKETSRLNNIINSLLEYVKPRKLQLEKIAMDELMEEVIFLVNRSREIKNDMIIKEASLNGIKIICDPQQMKQVFFNLIINAVEATGKDGKINIKAKKHRQDHKLEIEIIDNGMGMSQEQLKNLFEPFTSSKDKGIGLGLAIVSTIVKEHGGNIGVDSEVGKGTSFSVFLPYDIPQK